MAATLLLHKHILEELIIHNETLDQKFTNFQFKPEIRFHVLPKTDKQPPTGVMEIEIGDMDGISPIYIKLKLRGLYLFAGENDASVPIDQKTLHKQAFVQLFEHARTLISGVLLMSGMKPFILPPINPENLNIRKNNE